MFRIDTKIVAAVRSIEAQRGRNAAATWLCSQSKCMSFHLAQDVVDRMIACKSPPAYCIISQMHQDTP